VGGTHKILKGRGVENTNNFLWQNLLDFEVGRKKQEADFPVWDEKISEDEKISGV